MTEMHFFTSEKPKKYHAWSCQNVCDALTFLLDNIFIRFGTKLYRQVVGIPMGTNCAPLVADLFLFCYERDLMMSLSDDKQADVIDAFNTTSRYLDDILNTRGIWKVLSMVFYLSNRYTNLIMFGIILKSYLFSMLWHKFHEDIIMQTRKIIL